MPDSRLNTRYGSEWLPLKTQAAWPIPRDIRLPDEIILSVLNISLMNAVSSIPEVGQIVRVRQRLYLVADDPKPTVQMFLNVKRPFGDTSTDGELISAFAYRFRTEHWPRDRPLPEIYFDPRSLAMEAKRKAVLHAKCVVIDGRTSFVSSANFTEAAQERNIEVGVLVRSRVIAERLIDFFATLIAIGAAKRAL